MGKALMRQRQGREGATGKWFGQVQPTLVGYIWIGYSGDGAGLDVTLPGPDIVTSENNKAVIVVDLFDWRVVLAIPVPCEASIVLNGLGQYMTA